VEREKHEEISQFIKNLNSSVLSESKSSSSTSKIDPKEKKSNIFYCQKSDHIAYRYEVIEELGKGAFGRVLKVFDHKEKEEIALKILKAEDQFNEQGLNEMGVLKRIKEIGGASERNVVEYKQHFVFREHISFTFDLMDMNLYDVIKGRNF